MRLEWILWAAGGLLATIFLLTMMRRRQQHLIELLMEFVKLQKDRGLRTGRAQRLMEQSEKIRGAKDQAKH